MAPTIRPTQTPQNRREIGFNEHLSHSSSRWSVGEYFELERIQGLKANARFYTQETGKQCYELDGREIFEIDGTELHQSRGGTISGHDRPGRSLGVVDTRNAQVDQLDAAGGSEGSQSIKSTAPNIQHNSDGQTLPPQVVRVSSDEKDFANIDLSTVAATSMLFTNPNQGVKSYFYPTGAVPFLTISIILANHKQ